MGYASFHGKIKYYTINGCTKFNMKHIITTYARQDGCYGFLAKVWYWLYWWFYSYGKIYYNSVCSKYGDCRKFRVVPIECDNGIYPKWLSWSIYMKQ